MIQGVTASRRHVRKSEGPGKHIAPATEDWVQGRRGEFNEGQSLLEAIADVEGEAVLGQAIGLENGHFIGHAEIDGLGQA